MHRCFVHYVHPFLLQGLPCLIHSGIIRNSLLPFKTVSLIPSQAKENEAKYTGVSAEDARMGKGFGSSSSYGNEGAFRSGVAFGSGSGSIASRGFGSTTGGFRSSQERYDDHDEGHQSLRLEDSDMDEVQTAAFCSSDGRALLLYLLTCCESSCTSILFTSE